MRPQQVLPLQARVDLGVMVMKGYSMFFKAPGLEPHHQMFSVILRTLVVWGGDGYLSEEVQLAYSIAPVNKTC